MVNVLDLDHLTGMLRGLILRRLGLSGDEETINKCKEMFQAHLDEIQAIPADLRSAVYWYVLLELTLPRGLTII